MKREWVWEQRKKITLLGVVNGLSTEIGLIASALQKHRPDAIGISINASEIEALRNWKGEAAEEVSEFDLFYIRQLSRFGEVTLPSPSHLYVVQFSQASGIPLIPLDMDEEEYTELYMKLVSPYSLFFDALFRGRRYRKRLTGDLDEVVLQIDRIAQHPQGIARLDRAREERIASNIGRCFENYSNVLVVVDLERMEGVLSALKSMGISLQ